MQVRVARCAPAGSRPSEAGYRRPRSVAAQGGGVPRENHLEPLQDGLESKPGGQGAGRRPLRVALPSQQIRPHLRPLLPLQSHFDSSPPPCSWAATNLSRPVRDGRGVRAIHSSPGHRGKCQQRKPLGLSISQPAKAGPADPRRSPVPATPACLGALWPGACVTAPQALT